MRSSLSRAALAAAWAPAVGYMALIWVVSSLSLPPMPIEQVPLRDKGVHFVEYAVLGFLVAHAILRTWPRHSPLRTLTLAVIATVLFGLLDEIHQAFVPGRSSEALDVVADGAGAVAGSLARWATDVVRGRALRGRAPRGRATGSRLA